MSVSTTETAKLVKVAYWQGTTQREWLAAAFAQAGGDFGDG